MYGYFAAAGAENEALRADYIAYVEFLEFLEGLLSQVVYADVHLYTAAHVHKIAEKGLAHVPLAHHSPGYGDVLVFKGVEAVLYFAGIRAALKTGLLERIPAAALQSGKLFAADLQYFAEFLTVGDHFFFGHGWRLLFISLSRLW